MSSSFFIKSNVASQSAKKGKNTAGLKRKIGDAADGKSKLRAKKASSKHNEEISSDSETEGPPVSKKRQPKEDGRYDETPQEKKLRLAKLYLEQLREEEEKKAEDEHFETDLIAGRLQEKVLEQQGKLQRLIAKELIAPDSTEIRVLRGHKLPITCLVLTPDDKCIFSGAKDCSIIKWDIASGKKLHTIPGGRKGTEERHVGHTAHILCMALSSDGKYLASGDMNKLIMIWEGETCKHLYKFTGHKGPISGLSFRKGTHDLYSASHDRSVKVWNVDENAYVFTLISDDTWPHSFSARVESVILVPLLKNSPKQVRWSLEATQHSFSSKNDEYSSNQEVLFWFHLTIGYSPNPLLDHPN
uniref:Ribosomal RNA processing 9, U3 small nucleolar RNA binding protein n=1 Tax=Oryzias sinensis TaxID=183150 RepID=A0A8C7XUE6_9TELE